MALSFRTIAAGCMVLIMYLPMSPVIGKPWDSTFDGKGRFEVLHGFNDEAVLDKETNLVWEKSPFTTKVNWVSGRLECAKKAVGGRKGWRLPAFYELASLVDTSGQNVPTLPNDHPFVGVQSGIYWSATLGAINTSLTPWYVNFSSGHLATAYQHEGPYYYWCVRGGGAGADRY